jgi:hypothetical protein
MVSKLQYVVRDATTLAVISVDRRPVIALSKIQDALDASLSLGVRYTTALGDKGLFTAEALVKMALLKPVLKQDIVEFQALVAGLVASQTGKAGNTFIQFDNTCHVKCTCYIMLCVRVCGFSCVDSLQQS